MDVPPTFTHFVNRVQEREWACATPRGPFGSPPRPEQKKSSLTQKIRNRRRQQSDLLPTCYRWAAVFVSCVIFFTFSSRNYRGDLLFPLADFIFQITMKIFLFVAVAIIPLVAGITQFYWYKYFKSLDILCKSLQNRVKSLVFSSWTKKVFCFCFNEGRGCQREQKKLIKRRGEFEIQGIIRSNYKGEI